MSDQAGVAYVQLVPSMRGFSREVTKGLGNNLTGPLRKAGEDGGRELSGGVTSGMDKAHARIGRATDRIGKILKAGLAAAGVAAGLVLMAGISDAIEQEKATDYLVAQLGGSEWAGEMGEIAGRLYRDAFGDSIADTGEVLQAVIRSPLVVEDDTNERIEEVTALALTFTDVMNKDVERSIRATSTLMRTGLADSAENAFDILTRGIQQGGDQADDLLDTLIEYPVQFQALGLTAEDSIGLLLQGLKAGARDTDTVADALKEFSIRGKDASKASAEGFALIGLSAEEMTAKVAAGGPEAREALDQVIKGLADLEDPAQRDAAAVALFGTKSEDLQAALGALDLDTAAMQMGDVEGATDQLGSAYDNAATKIESFKRKALGKLVSFIGGTVIPLLERFAGWIEPIFSTVVDEVGPIITQVIEGWETLKGAFVEGDDFGADGIAGAMADIGLAFREAQPFIDKVGEAWELLQPPLEWFLDNETAMTATIGAIAAVIGIVLAGAVIAALAPVLELVGIFLLAGLAIAGVVAGFVWLYENVEEFRAVVDEALPIIADIFTGSLELIETTVTDVVAVISAIWSEWGDEIVELVTIAWGIVSEVVLGALQILGAQIEFWTAIFQGDWSRAWAAFQDILAGAWRVIWAILRGALQLMWLTVRVTFELIHGIVTGKMDDVRSYIGDRIDDVVGFFAGLPGRIGRAIASLARVMSAPFRAAFSAIQRAWNSTVGGFSVSIPGLFGFGGASFSIPRMHTGGLVPGVGDQLILAKGGEGVFTEEQMAALGGAPAVAPAAAANVVLSVDGESMFIRWIKSLVRIEGGGDVNVAFGGT